MKLSVYLDTNHLSTLARHPTDATSIAFLDALNECGAVIALSIVHLIELSDPRFLSAQLTREFLDGVPHVWFLAPDDLWFAELDCAFARYAGHERPVKPFVTDVNQMLGGAPLGAVPSQALEAFSTPQMRLKIEELANRGLAFELLKRTARIVAEPLALLQKMVQQRLPQCTSVGGLMPSGTDARVLIRAVGGLEGFPSYGLQHKVGTGRLKDARFVAKRSDVFDLLHVGYAAYASITALERGHAGRVKAARPLLSERVTHRISEATTMIRAAAI